MTDFGEYFSDDLIGNFYKGKQARNMFVENVEQVFTDWEDNAYICGQAGVGKTWIVDNISQKYPDIKFVKIEGQLTSWFFAKQLAVDMYMADMEGADKILIYLDDLNTLFSTTEMVDIFKEMLKNNGDGSLSYNRGINISGIKDPMEREAIEYWRAKQPQKVGFQIPFNDRVRFIMTMNTPLPHTSEVAKMKADKKKHTAESLAAIRSRIGDGYYDLIMNKDQMWGWIAHVVWTDPTMCAGATQDQRKEILQYLWDGWEKCNERSLRFVEFTMWKIMKKHPERREYQTRWARHFTNSVVEAK